MTCAQGISNTSRPAEEPLLKSTNHNLILRSPKVASPSRSHLSASAWPRSFKEMAPDILFDDTLPVCIHPPTTAPQQTFPKTSLTATLSYSPTESTLSLTLSDLTSRLLLLNHIQSADTFPSARSPTSLIVDFPAYPALVAKYFRLTHSNSPFVAFLELDPTHTHTPSPIQPILRVIEFEQGYNITRIQLPLTYATQHQLISELAHRARTAQQLTLQLTQLRTQLHSLQNDNTTLTSKLDNTHAQIATSENQRSKIEQLTQTVTELRTQVAETRTERDQSENARLLAEQRAAHAASELATLKACCEEHTAQHTESMRKQAEHATLLEAITAQRENAVAEIRKGNKVISTLQERVRAQQIQTRTLEADAKSARAKGKVKGALIAKLEERISSLERDSRRVRDRAAMLEVEKDGLQGRLNSVMGKLEENRATIDSDQQVIAYLNRELNDRLMSEISPSGSGRGRGTSPGTRQVADIVGT